MNKLISDLNNHIIICGFGQVGREACQNLIEEERDFIVIDKDVDRVHSAVKMGYLAIMGDATDETVLEKAEIKNAKGIITTFSDTSANVYVTLAVKEINSKLFMVARGTDERSEKILYRAGADKVVSPAQIGGKKMVSTICHNVSLELVNRLIQDKKVDIKFVEVTLSEDSPIVGKTLAQSNIRETTGGIMVLAVRPIDSDIKINPAADLKFNPDDKVIVIGSTEQIEKFQVAYKTGNKNLKYIQD